MNSCNLYEVLTLYSWRNVIIAHLREAAVETERIVLNLYSLKMTLREDLEMRLDASSGLLLCFAVLGGRVMILRSVVSCGPSLG
jgi:hypothetical protein